MKSFLSRLLTPLAMAVVAPMMVLLAFVVAVVRHRFGIEFAFLATLGVVVSVLATLSAWQTAERFTTSVQQVTEALLGLAEGELFGSRLDPPAVDETAALVEAFNKMSARLYQSVDALARSQREFRRAVAQLGDTLAGTHNLTRILEVVLETSVLLLEGGQAVFYAVNPSRTRIEARVSAGGEVTGAIEAGAGLAGTVAARTRSLRYPGDAPPLPPEPACNAAVAVPIFSRGVIFGVVAVYGTSTGSFGPDDVETLEALVRQAETAVDNVFLHEEAQRLSITDGLTGLWNRREFELRCRQELDRAVRFGRSVALVICDLDHFKDLNDTWGHLGGDAVLVELSQRLSRSTREVDTVARFGGEEFVLVLPETALAGAAILAEKIRRAVYEVPFEFEGRTSQVTISLGVAAYPESGTNFRELLAAADHALYRAKRAGRNRVEVEEDTREEGLAEAPAAPVLADGATVAAADGAEAPGPEDTGS